MPNPSAGIIAYRFNNKKLEVLLVHPGGPFFIKKDVGVWSIPKGEYGKDEEPFAVALREFEEETGNKLVGENFIELAPVKTRSGKLISTWAIETNFEACFISSNEFTMEWPPKSGKQQSFAEVDDAAWFTINNARQKLNPGQIPIIEQLVSILAHQA